MKRDLESNNNKSDTKKFETWWKEMERRLIYSRADKIVDDLMSHKK